MSEIRYKTVKDIQNELNVSLATVNNWLRTGVIPQPQKFNRFTEAEYRQIIRSLTSSNSPKLKARANRSRIEDKHICFLGIKDPHLQNQLKEAIAIYEKSGFGIEEGVFMLCLSFLNSSQLLNKDWFLSPQTEIEFFLVSWMRENKLNLNEQMKETIQLFRDLQLPLNNTDFIGAFYQSIQTVSTKSKTGSYYTPPGLLQDIEIPLGSTVLDPCCGSGGILLKVLNEKHNPAQIYAWDIDELALKICRVNLCLFFNDPNIKPNLKRHDIIFKEDSGFNNCLENCFEEQFDYIITNPPWGSKFTQGQKDLLLKKYPLLKTTESFSITLYNSFLKLAPEGTLIFFLPYSFLNVFSHGSIREYLLKQRISLTIRLLGNAFEGVMSEAIRLEISKARNSLNSIMVFSKKNPSPTIIPLSGIQAPDYIIPATAANQELKVIEKIYQKDHFLLKGNAMFALGVVTGNNKEHLQRKATESSEPIFRGKDILPFQFKTPELFIQFNPAIYQQVAPVEMYRQRKIVYRFISDRIICVLDSEKRLLLNSANLFIPTLDYPLETIVALFNSELYTFLYRKIFHSKKVLRSHLESLPLPLLSQEEHLFFKVLHEKYRTGDKDLRELDYAVYEIFGLKQKEIQIVEQG